MIFVVMCGPSLMVPHLLESVTAVSRKAYQDRKWSEPR